MVGYPPPKKSPDGDFWYPSKFGAKAGSTNQTELENRETLTSHNLGLQKVAEKGKSPYFMEIQVGEILELGQNEVLLKG